CPNPAVPGGVLGSPAHEWTGRVQGRLAILGVRDSPRVSDPLRAYGPVWPRTPPCQGGDRGFKSRYARSPQCEGATRTPLVGASQYGTWRPQEGRPSGM